MRKMNPDNTKTEGHELVVIQNISDYRALAKTNRLLLRAVALLTVLVFILGFVALPSRDVTDGLKNRPLAVAATQNPVLSAQLDSIKGQLFGLLSGSIESKLRTLEEGIKTGSVSTSLGAIEDLKSDLQVLRTYSQSEPKAEEAAQNQHLLDELSRLKGLVYLTFASCGVMIAAVVGVWLKNRYRLRHQSFHRAFLGQRIDS